MKRLIKLFSISFFVLAIALTLFACGNNTEKLEPENVKKDAYGALKVYSIDLSDIPGYEDKSVTNGTWQETYDALIGYAKKEADDVKRTKLYHKAEDLLMSTGTIVPIYYYTDIYMKKENVDGFFGTPSGSKFFKYATVGGSSANINICLASEPDTIDPAKNSSVDGATIILHTFAGLVGYNDKGELVADLATELPTPVANADGSVTYTFTIKDNAKWSDGSAVTADDFVYAWNRAADPNAEFDYGYLFEIVAGYGEKDGLEIASLDGGKKLSVKLPVDVPYFFELCAFPTFMPVKKSVVEANPEGWATSPQTYVCNGPYTIESWDHNSKIVLVKNANYVNASTIKMEKITNFLSDDDINILAGYKSGAYDFIDTVPNDEIPNLKQTYTKEFFVAGQLGTYYVIFNNNTNLVPSNKAKDLSKEEVLKANQEIRLALSLLIDRNYIVEEIGQAGQVPASSFVAMGITNADGSEFYKTAGGNSYAGYFNTAADAYAANCKKAVETLKKYFQYDEKTKKFTNFTKFDYLYNTGTGHQAIGEYIQSAFAAYGIEMTLANQEWATFLETRKNGDYTVARNGWLADYNDPINMLDMWASYSGNNDAQLGK